MKPSQVTMVREACAWPNGPGWVLDFSDATFAAFFEDELGVDIDDDRFRGEGTSKGKRLMSFLRQAEPLLVAKVLRLLWEHRQELIDEDRYPSPDDPQNLERRFLGMIASIEEGADLPSGDALYAFTTDETLDELITDLERDLAAGKPAAALDHLHTYVTKKLRYLLDARGETTERDEALHSLFGRYRKILLAERDLHPVADRSLKMAIGTMEAFNDVRNHRSFAHDNELLPADEARLAYDVVTAVLRFIRSVEAGRYERT